MKTDSPEAELLSGLREVAGSCIVTRLRRLSRAVTNAYDDALRPLDLKVSQLSVLVATGLMGIARPGDLCEKLHLDVSTLSRNVERMKARGWVEVVPDVTDARSQPLRLTPEGRKLLKQALPAWRSVQSRIANLLAHDFIEQVNRTVKALDSNP